MSFQGKKNVYTCEKCGGRTVTIDKDDGTTPFMIRCRAKDHPIKGSVTIVGCSGSARSALYRGCEFFTPEYEWYRPSAEERDRWAKHRFGAGIVDHIDMGGLLLRHIETGATDLAAD